MCWRVFDRSKETATFFCTCSQSALQNKAAHHVEQTASDRTHSGGSANVPDPSGEDKRLNIFEKTPLFFLRLNVQVALLKEGKAAKTPILQTAAFSSLAVFQGMMPAGIENGFAGSVSFEHLSHGFNISGREEEREGERQIR